MHRNKLRVIEIVFAAAFVFGLLLAGVILLIENTQPPANADPEEIMHSVTAITVGDYKGGGVVVGPGVVLIAGHLAQQPDRQVVVTFYEGTSLVGRARWVDKALDVALVEVDGAIPPRAQPLEISCEPLKLGERLNLYGFPLGTRWVMQPVWVAQTRGPAPGNPEGFMLITGTVYPGNSGGPAVDERGRVRGLLSQRTTTDAQGSSEEGPITVTMPANYSIITSAERFCVDLVRPANGERP